MLSRNMKNNYVKKTMKKKMMEVKMKDAIFQLEKMKKTLRARLEYLQNRWGHNTNVMREYKQIMQAEIEETWKTGRREICTLTGM